jgi:flagellar hook assembly protein FlgD
VCATDHDGDGDLDLAVAMWGNNRIVYLAQEAMIGVTTGFPEPCVVDLSIVPNPFNPSTTVHVTLPHTSRVTVDIVSAGGTLVRSLTADELLTAGVYRITWDGRTDSGLEPASGVYFVRLTTPSGTKSAKAMLMK